MKKILLPAGSFLMIAVLILVSARSYGSEKITVMNPAISNTMVDRVPLAKRLDSLDGKTIYLVDINWGGPDAGYSVFEEMQIWFSKNMPGVKTVLKRKQGPYEADDRGLWKEINERGDAAIIGISG
jgi:hypothetical protein